MSSGPVYMVPWRGTARHGRERRGTARQGEGAGAGATPGPRQPYRWKGWRV
jgi:hypothetical protein